MRGNLLNQAVAIVIKCIESLQYKTVQNSKEAAEIPRFMYTDKYVHKYLDRLR